MDTLTHALSGALMARATAPRPGTPDTLPLSRRIGLGFFAAAFPDLDVVTSWMSPLSYLYYHRGVTHSLVLLPRWSLLLAIVLGLLVAAKLIQRQPPERIFGEAMMFVYYGCAFPLSTRILRGFYDDGIWSDAGFMHWTQISAMSWKEEGRITLILISHFRNIARRLEVPAHLYGQARRVLRDKIRDHASHIGGAGLDLGSRDDTDTV